jgi:hypothetical protein
MTSTIYNKWKIKKDFKEELEQEAKMRRSLG